MFDDNGEYGSLWWTWFGMAFPDLVSCLALGDLCEEIATGEQ